MHSGMCAEICHGKEVKTPPWSWQLNICLAETVRPLNDPR